MALCWRSMIARIPIGLGALAVDYMSIKAGTRT